MPELPEVEIISKNLNQIAKNKIIKEVIIRNINLREKIIENDISELVGEKILSIKRRGKYIVIFFYKFQVVVHLGMSGTFNCHKINDNVKKHSHVDLVLTDGSILRYNDPRRFGIFIRTNNYEELKYIKNCGVEPLEIDNLGEFLYKKSRKSKVSIKPFLMKNNMVVGVGNIYANESLFLSEISPLRKANDLSSKEFKALSDNIISILKKSINLGGTTLKDHRNGMDQKGSFQNELNVYGKEKCKKCGNNIKRIIQSQRTTFYCDNCQN